MREPQQAMREPQQAMSEAKEQQSAAVQRAAMTAEKQMAVAKMTAVHAAQQLQDAESAPESKKGDGSDSGVAIDLLPPKDGVKGGQAKELQASVEEAFEDKPNEQNSHYIPDHTDKEVHLLVIFFLLLGTISVYYFWKSKDAK